MRLILALVAAAVVSGLGAVMLGEYTFSGPAVLAMGVVFGLLVSEAAVTVAPHPPPGQPRRNRTLLGVACAAIAAAGMLWSAWISTGHDLSFLEPEGWVAVGLSAAAAGLRAWWTRPARDTAPTEPAPAE